MKIKPSNFITNSGPMESVNNSYSGAYERKVSNKYEETGQEIVPMEETNYSSVEQDIILGQKKKKKKKKVKKKKI
jgi:hypothetical protein